MRKQLMETFNPALFAAMFLTQCGHVDGTGKADANETVVFGRQLETAIAGSFDVKYAKTEWRTFVPVRMVNPGSNVVSYKQFDVVGEAGFVADYTKDFPKVELKGAEFFSKFASIGASYGYSIQDWREAQMAGFPLDAKKATAARDAIERTLDKLACVGDATHNLTGLANNTNVPVSTNGASGTTGLSLAVWLPTGGGTTATAKEIFEDVAFITKKIVDDTYGIFTPDTLLLPRKIYSYLNSVLFQSTYNTKTVMQALLEANPWIKNVEMWARLDSAGADGKGRIVVYKRDPDVAEMVMAQDFESFAPQMKGMEFTIMCHARPGTVQVRYPKAMGYLDGCGGTDA